MKNKTLIHMFVDESGTFHDGETKYFILGGLIVLDEFKFKIKRKYKNIIKKFTLNQDDDFELKSSWFRKKSYNKQIELIQELDNYLDDKEAIMFSLIVNVEEHKRLSNLDSMKSIKNSENIRYNYFLKIAIKNLYKHFNEFLKDKNITLNINCDSRTTKVSTKNELNNYLALEVAENVSEVMDIIVTYHDSKSNYLIQVADMISGLKFKQYNRTENFELDDLEKVKKLKNIWWKEYN